MRRKRNTENKNYKLKAPEIYHKKGSLCAPFFGVQTPTTPTTPMDSTPMDSTEYGSTKTYPLQWTPMTDSTC